MGRFEPKSDVIITIIGKRGGTVPEHVALIEKWQAWLERIDGELNALRGKCNVFNRVVEIVRANPAISQPGTFHDLIISGYGAYMCMGLRRLCEPQNKRADRKIVSVRALLEEFCEHPDVLSRQRIRDGRERVRGGCGHRVLVHADCFCCQNSSQ